MGGGFTVTVITKKNAGQDILRSCFFRRKCFGGDHDRTLDNILTCFLSQTLGID